MVLFLLNILFNCNSASTQKMVKEQMIEGIIFVACRRHMFWALMFGVVMNRISILYCERVKRWPPKHSITRPLSPSFFPSLTCGP